MRKAMIPIILLSLSLQCGMTSPLQAQEGPEVRVYSINGFEMYVEISGHGEPLLLVHGWSGNADYFEPLLEELSAHFRLIIPELRGHGRSTNPSGSLTTRQAAADVMAVLDSLGIDHVRALGASAGALTLMHMALEDPTVIESMILVGSGTHFRPACKASLAETDADSYPPEWWEVMRQRHPRGDEQIRGIAAMLPELAATEDDVAFTPEVLGAIQAPTFIVHGDSDWCFPASMAAGMHDAIPDSRLWVLPEGEHVPILGESASLFLELAVEFLQQNRGSPPQG